MNSPLYIRDALPLRMFAAIQDDLEYFRMENVSNNQTDKPFWGIGQEYCTSPQFIAIGYHLKLKIQKAIKASLSLDRIRVNCTTGAMEGGSFHVDCKNDTHISAILFASPNWNVQWGGETVVYDGSEYHYGTFIPNSCYVFPSHWDHYGSSPNVRANETRVTLAYRYEVCYNYPIATN